MNVPLQPMFYSLLCKVLSVFRLTSETFLHVVDELMQMTIVSFKITQELFSMKVPLQPMFEVCFAKFDLSFNRPLKLFHIL